MPWRPKLVYELVEAADDKHLTKTVARYGRMDLLRIDELGSDRAGALVAPAMPATRAR